MQNLISIGLKWDPSPYIYRLFNVLIRFDHFLAAVTRFDHCAADSEAQQHSAGFTGLLGFGRGKYNNILQQL